MTFDELYDQHVTKALRLAVLLVGDRHRAEDIVAEAFSRVLPHWRGHVLDFAPSGRTWVPGVVEVGHHQAGLVAVRLVRCHCTGPVVPGRP